MEYKRTARGFIIYGEIKDTYDSTITISESAAVGEEHIWIQCCKIHTNEKFFPHLNVEQAEILIGHLQNFIKHSKSDDNVRNKAEYKKIHCGKKAPEDMKYVHMSAEYMLEEKY